MIEVTVTNEINYFIICNNIPIMCSYEDYRNYNKYTMKITKEYFVMYLEEVRVFFHSFSPLQYTNPTNPIDTPRGVYKITFA